MNSLNIEELGLCELTHQESASIKGGNSFDPVGIFGDIQFIWDASMAYLNAMYDGYGWSWAPYIRLR